MVGILVQLAVSWLIVWLLEKKNLSVLGLFPTKTRLNDFLIFFLITAFCCASEFIMKMLFADQHWRLNPDLSFMLILKGTWWNLKSVLFEELIFRGVLLYILIKRFGANKAILVSAITFGVYHWFSYELFGNVQQMIFVFIVTGLMGLICAYGYAKSFSLYIPIAIHLGWNFTRSVIFSESAIGKQLLIQSESSKSAIVSPLVYYCILLLPMFSALLFSFILIKKKKQAGLSR